VSDISLAAPQQSLGRRTAVRLLLLTALLGLPQIMLLVWLSLGHFEGILLPELERKATVVGDIARVQVNSALSDGIPMDELVGAQTFFDDYLKHYPEIRFIALTDASGRVVQSSGLAADAVARTLAMLPPAAERIGRPMDAAGLVVSSLPLDEHEARGFIHLSVDRTFVEQQMREFTLDIAVIAVVMLIVAFEVLVFVVAVMIDHPLNLISRMIERIAAGDFSWYLAGISWNELGLIARAFNKGTRDLRSVVAAMRQLADEMYGASADQAGRFLRMVDELTQRWHFVVEPSAVRIRDINIVVIRLPLFLFVFSEEMLRPFFPLYVDDIYATSGSGLDPNLAVSLPMSLFMACAAIGTTAAGVWSDRYGSRRIFCLGSGLAAAGLFLTALIPNYWALVGWRCVGALGYGLVFIAAQSYVLRNSSAANRAKSVAIYAGAITAADICGPAIGGVIADRFGPTAVFFTASAMVAIGAVIVWLLLREDADPVERPPLKLAYFLELARNPRFVMLLLCLAIPAKLMLTGFLFYLVPQFGAALGNGEATIGQIIMLYGLMGLVGTPVSAFLSDRIGREAVIAGLGGLLAGAGAVGMWFGASTWTLTAAVAALGLGQAIAVAPQLALVPRICPNEVGKMGLTTVVSVYRISERLGGVIGPFVVGAFVTLGGASGATIWTGSLVCGLAALFTVYFAMQPPASLPERERHAPSSH
jgi:predicted MFS family arabinose efflux permease